VRRWHREGRLAAGHHFSCSWTYSGAEPAGSIDVSTESHAVVLSYFTRHPSANEWKSINQRVPITWTDCHFGGRRPWFVCAVYSNGRYCGRRVAVLYGPGAYFACRRCYGLAYASQQEAIRERGFIRARKILIRLGAKPDLFNPFPEKPLRMHWRTYERLYGTYEIAKGRCFRAIMGHHRR
jgi:hypothetical protein